MLYFQFRLGQYFPEKLVNIGTNRWGFKPEIGFSRRQGSWYFEAYGGVWFFTRNEDFLETSNLEQKAILSFQGHVSHLFPKKNWIALNGGYADGGQTSINGVLKNNIQKNWRLGATYSMPLSKRSSIRGMVNTGLCHEGGSDLPHSLLSINIRGSNTRMTRMARIEG